MSARVFSAAELLALPSFPRITPDEEFLLRDFVRELGRIYHGFSIDVPVGHGASVVDERSGVVDRVWASITRRRIDLLAYHDAGVDVVEAKLVATFRAASQVQTYVDDYRLEHCDVRQVRPVIVCRSASYGIASLLYQRGGRLIELPRTFAEITPQPFDSPVR